MMGSILGRLIDRLKLDWRRYRIPLATHRVVDAVKQQKLTYLSREKLQMLAHLCRMNERTGVPGAVIETGCALGGSSIVMASAKDPRRRLCEYTTCSTKSHRHQRKTAMTCASDTKRSRQESRKVSAAMCITGTNGMYMTKSSTRLDTSALMSPRTTSS